MLTLNKITLIRLAGDQQERKQLDDKIDLRRRKLNSRQERVKRFIEANDSEEEEKEKAQREHEERLNKIQVHEKMSIEDRITELCQKTLSEPMVDYLIR